MSEFLENRKHPADYLGMAFKLMVVILLMTVAYYAGYADCMRVAVETGNAVKVEDGFKWKR